jgi:hypothetical protein
MRERSREEDSSLGKAFKARKAESSFGLLACMCEDEVPSFLSNVNAVSVPYAEKQEFNRPRHFCAVVKCTPADRWFDAWKGK